MGAWFRRIRTEQSANSTESSNLNLKFVSVLRIGYFVAVDKVTYTSNHSTTSRQRVYPSTSAEQEHVLDAVPKES